LDGGSACRKAATYTQNNTNTEKRTQTSMPRVGFEPRNPAFDREKTIHDLDNAAAVIGYNPLLLHIFSMIAPFLLSFFLFTPFFCSCRTFPFCPLSYTYYTCTADGLALLFPPSRPATGSSRVAVLTLNQLRARCQWKQVRVSGRERKKQY
jgi:hypothetical protein